MVEEDAKMDADEDGGRLAALTADIVVADVSNYKVGAAELAGLIASTYAALSTADAPAPVEPEGPAKLSKAEIRKSVTPDYLTSFLDGRRYKSLKRHLGRHGLTPETYRTRYGLGPDYPMTAAAYSAMRSEHAKSRRFGQKPPQAPEPAAAPAKPPRGRKAAKPQTPEVFRDDRDPS